MEWLRADLAIWTKRLESGELKVRNKVQQTLRQWLSDSDLLCLRDETTLARLPESERKMCRELWAEVETLLQRIR